MTLCHLWAVCLVNRRSALDPMEWSIVVSFLPVGHGFDFCCHQYDWGQGQPTRIVTLPTGAVAKYCDEYVCGSVCPPGYLMNHTHDLTKFFMHVACVRGSVLIRHVDDRLHCLSPGRGFLLHWKCIISRKGDGSAQRGRSMLFTIVLFPFARKISQHVVTSKPLNGMDHKVERSWEWLDGCVVRSMSNWRILFWLYFAGIVERFQGFNNDFKEAMDQVDQDYLKEILKTTSSGFSELTDVNVQDDGTTYEQVMVVELSYTLAAVWN